MVSMRTAVGVCLGLALAGCGSSSGSGPTITSFTATPGSLPTAGGSVTLAWTVTGATSLSINQGVGTVTPVTTGSTTAQVTATTTFILSATNSGGTSTSTAQVTVAPSITVNGTVTDEYGVVAAGETVLITSGTFSESAVSGADGTFSIAHVPTPYNATILDSGGTIAVQYQGLTRPDPTVFDFVNVPQTRSANLAGSLTGGTFPEGSGDSTFIAFSSPQTTLPSSNLNLVSSGPNYSGSVGWLGPSSTTGTLYALEVHSVSNLPVDYPGYGTVSSVLLEDGISYSGQAIPLSPVTTGTVSGTINAPAGYPLVGQELALVPTPGVFFSLADFTTSSTSFTFTTPDISTASLLFLTQVKGASGDLTLLKKTVSPNDTGLAVTVPAPPTLTLPVDSATGVTVATPFAWTNFTGVTFLLVGGTHSFVVVTSASTATIPDLSSAGLPLSPSASYNWQLYAVGPATTVDAVAVPGGLFALELGEGYFSESVSRSFTSGP
jgi:hypothetical protein